MEKNEKKSLSLFSAETLDSIAMAEVLGGADNCKGGNCVQQCACSNSGNGSCNTVNVKGQCTKGIACKGSGDLIPITDQPPTIIATPFLELNEIEEHGFF
jgi:hypothetical protein